MCPISALPQTRQKGFLRNMIDDSLYILWQFLYFVSINAKMLEFFVNCISKFFREAIDVFAAVQCLT